MKELSLDNTLSVNGGLSSQTCTALVVGGSALVGGAAAGYFSFGTGFGVGATAGGFYGIFIASYVCN